MTAFEQKMIELQQEQINLLKEMRSANNLQVSGLLDMKQACELLFGTFNLAAKKKIGKLRRTMALLTRPPHAPKMYYYSELIRIKDQLDAGEITVKVN